MSKVTGQPIKFSEAEKLRANLNSFQNDPEITTIIQKTTGVNTRLQTFLSNLNCGFVFDKESLRDLINKIERVPDSGLVMMMCASNSSDRDRADKPTLSIFPCKIDRIKDEYEIMFDAIPGETPGTEHPGIVKFDSPKIEKRGPIGFLNI